MRLYESRFGICSLHMGIHLILTIQVMIQRKENPI